MEIIIKRKIIQNAQSFSLFLIFSQDLIPPKPLLKPNPPKNFSDPITSPINLVQVLSSYKRMHPPRSTIIEPGLLHPGGNGVHNLPGFKFKLVSRSPPKFLYLNKLICSLSSNSFGGRTSFMVKLQLRSQKESP